LFEVDELESDDELVLVPDDDGVFVAELPPLP